MEFLQNSIKKAWAVMDFRQLLMLNARGIKYYVLIKRDPFI
jgi:hypothetical protein